MKVTAKAEETEKPLERKGLLKSVGRWWKRPWSRQFSRKMQITLPDSEKAMLMEEFSRKSRKQVIKELFPP